MIQYYYVSIFIYNIVIKIYVLGGAMKNTYKLLVSLLLCLIFTFVICACGNTSDTDTNQGDTGSGDKAESTCEHTWEVIKGKESTCTEKGISNGKACSKCGEILEAQEVTEALGHSKMTIQGRAATCVKTGLTDGEKCARCGEILKEQQEIKMIPHSYDYYGSCQGCTSVIGEAVVVVLDISSSMKALMGEGSRFTTARDSLLEFIGDFRDYDYFGLILFDGNTHVAMDLAKIENKEQFLKKTEYNLNHLYYAYYLDKDGNETDIVVNQSDGDKYISEGYTIPEYGNGNGQNGGYDRFNGNAIKTYGTCYYNAIDKACQMYNGFEEEAISKKVIFISDGEPSDKGAGYVDIVESMAQNDIITTSIGLATNNTNAITEMTLIADAGNGVYRPAGDKRDLSIQLNITYRKAELDDKVGKVDDFVFVEYDEEYYLIAYEGNKKEITLPKEFNGKSYSVFDSAISNNNQIQKITVPSGISLSEDAIVNCPYLFSIVIEEGASFPSDFVMNCMRLQLIYNGNITDIRQSNKYVAIDNNRTMYKPVYEVPIDNETKIEITDDGYVFYKGPQATSNLTLLIGYIGDKTELVLPEAGPDGSDYHIEYGAFAKTNIKSIEIKSGVINVRDYAFTSDKLEKITFSQTKAITLNSSALYGCTVLKELNLGTLNINASVLTGISYESITVSEDNAYLMVEDNILFSKDKKTLIRYPNNKLDKEYIIPNTVNKIESSAFYGCTALTSITIPDGVTTIGSSAFLGCTSLTSVTIPSGVTSIGSSAFSGCTSLVEINFNATAMDDLNSNNNVFSNAGTSGDGIKVTIGKNVTKIPAYLFYPSSYLSYPPKITSVEFEEGSVCESIGDYSFYNCYMLESVMIGENVTTIGNNAFCNCHNLESVIIGENVTTIGKKAFFNCSSLKSITIPAGVKEIPVDAFTKSSISTIILKAGAKMTISYGVWSANNTTYEAGQELCFDEDTTLTLISGDSSHICVSTAEDFIYCLNNGLSVTLTKDITIDKAINIYYSYGGVYDVYLNGHTITFSSNIATCLLAQRTGLHFRGDGEIIYSGTGHFMYMRSYPFNGFGNQLIIDKGVKISMPNATLAYDDDYSSYSGYPLIKIYGNVNVKTLFEEKRANTSRTPNIEIYDGATITLNGAPTKSASSTDTITISVFGGAIYSNDSQNGFFNDSSVAYNITGGKFYFAKTDDSATLEQKIEDGYEISTITEAENTFYTVSQK